MPNLQLIYVIVVLNALCQAMLIWRLKLAQGTRTALCALTLLVPLAIALAMRLAVAGGVFHAKLAEQTGIERLITTVASILLIASPWLVTAWAIIVGKRTKKLHQIT